MISHVSNSSRILLLGSRVYCGRHVSHDALVFSRSKGNKKQSATSFSQRLLVKLHRYCATIRGSKLPLSQVYFAVSLLPFGASRQPKYVSFYLLSCKLLVFWFHLVSRFCCREISFTRSKAYCHMITKL